jgi:hypothetical protein
MPNEIICIFVMPKSGTILESAKLFKANVLPGEPHRARIRFQQNLRFLFASVFHIVVFRRRPVRVTLGWHLIRGYDFPP